MNKIVVFLGIASLAVSAAALAQDDGSIDPGGDSGDAASHIDKTPKNIEHPRAVARSGIDGTVERMFKAADTNNDGTVTLAEFNGTVDALKDQMIAQRFARIDTDHNQSISIAEFAAWQRSIGSVALSDKLDTPQTGQVAENLPIQYGRKDDIDYMSLLLEPLNATMIVTANANYDAGTTLPELLDYEHGLFDKADTNHDGFITWDEIDALRKKQGLVADVAPDDGPVPDDGPRGGLAGGEHPGGGRHHGGGGGRPGGFGGQGGMGGGQGGPGYAGQ